MKENPRVFRFEMETSIVLMEESHRRSDSSASAAKSVGSLVPINSIAIDLSSAVEEIESPAHEHFSIRGFVSGMRKKDWKNCSLFATECNDGDVVDGFPTLDVPKFRWWHCSSCIPEVATERSTLEMVLANRSGAGPNSCKNVDGGDGLFSHNREDTDYGDLEDNDPSNNMTNSNPCRTEGNKATSCSKDITDVRNKEGGNPRANIIEANPLQVKERDACSADAYDILHVAERVDEPYNASSGSNGTFIALPHKRKPKLRSLADIMEEERHPTIEHSRTKSASSSGMQVTSTEMEAVVAPPIQLDVPADVTKGTRSPQRKRKIALEEDRGPLETSYPSGAAKRLKGLMLDGERTCRRVETSDSESEGDASTRLNLQLGAKTQRSKPKKSRALDIHKKMRPIRIDNGTVKISEVPKINAVSSANITKHAVASENSVCKSGYAPSALGEMGPFVRTYPSGQQMERSSNSSKTKRPEVDANHNLFMLPDKSILGECNMKGKVVLDLSLNSGMDAERNSNNQSSFRQHRGIPDLNETFGQKAAMTRGKQVPMLFEERSLPLHKTLDISASCSKETAREGKRQLEFSKPPTVQSTDKNLEPGGASDDIPMEIVELLAKSKRERELGNLGKHYLPVEINNSIRGSPAPYVDGCSRMISFPLANARNGVNVASGNMCVSQNVPVNFSQLNRYQLDMSKMEESQFKLFTPFTSSQHRKPQYSASSSIMAGPRPSEGVDLLWPPRRENVPFHLSTHQNHSIPSNSMGVNSFPDQRHKGKTISDIKGGEGKRAMHDASVLKDVRIGSGPKSVGSLDPYSNDAIPAMQLLSLMDQGIVSGSSLKVGPKSFLDKPFSPCSHHPRLNGNENQKFPSGSIFSQNSHANDFPGLRRGVYCSGESSKRHSTYTQGQVLPEQGNSKAVYVGRPSNPVIQPSSSNSALGVCTFNRNPADFSFPDARNEFTISAKDLKPRNWNTSKERSRSVNVEGQKRPRVRKNASGKEGSRK